VLAIEHKWKDGDVVTIDMDMTVRAIPGGKSYPDAVAIQRGPQVLAAENSLNAEILSLPRTVSSVRPMPAPAAWTGTQVYTVDGVTLVPFADAVSMRVWIPVR
jgi:uncharacterized protein